jgi:hypothetical protein
MGFGVETPDGAEVGNVVTEVVNGGVAEENGVRIGHFLIAIGEKDVTGMDHEETVEFIFESARPLELTFQKKKKTHKKKKKHHKKHSVEKETTKGETDDASGKEATVQQVEDRDEAGKAENKTEDPEKATATPDVEGDTADSKKAETPDAEAAEESPKPAEEGILASDEANAGPETAAANEKSKQDAAAEKPKEAAVEEKPKEDAVEEKPKVDVLEKKPKEGAPQEPVKSDNAATARVLSPEKKAEYESKAKTRVPRVQENCPETSTVLTFLQEMVEDETIPPGVVDDFLAAAEVSHDEIERKEILNLAINSWDKTKKDILGALQKIEAVAVERLADSHIETTQEVEKPPTPPKAESEIEWNDEESDEEHPEIEHIQEIVKSSMNRYVPMSKLRVDKNRSDYVERSWLLTADEDFADDPDPFEDSGNNADPEFRELAMESITKKYLKGLQTLHKAYSQMPGNDNSSHNKGINKTFDSLKNSKNRLGWVPFLRLCKDFNLITRENKILRNSRTGTGYEDIATVDLIIAGNWVGDEVVAVSKTGKLPILRDEAKAIFKRVAGKKSQYNYISIPQLMEVIFGIVLKAWPRMSAAPENHDRELWSDTALKVFQNVAKNPHDFRGQYRTLKEGGAVDRALRRIRRTKAEASQRSFLPSDVIIVQVMEDYKATPEELEAFEGEAEDEELFEEMKKGDQFRILALQNDDIGDDEEELDDDFEEWVPIPKDRNQKFGVQRLQGQYWLAQRITLGGKKIDDDYAHFEHRGIAPAAYLKVISVKKEKPLTEQTAATRIQKLARGSMLRIRRQRIWDNVTIIASMVRGQQQRKRYLRAKAARQLQASCVVERLLDKLPDFPKLYTMLERLNISNRRKAIDSTIAKSRGFVFAQGNFKDRSPGNIGKRDDMNKILMKDKQRVRRPAPRWNGPFAKGKPDRVRKDLPHHDPHMDAVQDLFSYGLQMLFKAYCATYGVKKLNKSPTFDRMKALQSTISLQGFAQLCADFKLLQPTFKGSKMCQLYVDDNGDHRFSHEGYMKFDRKYLQEKYQRWCVLHQDPNDTHTAIRDWKNLADILADLAWESYLRLGKNGEMMKGVTRAEVAAALYTRMSLAEDDVKHLVSTLMGYGRGMTFADGKHPGMKEKYVYQLMKYETKGASHPVDRMRMALHERKSRGMDIKALFTNLDAQSYGWEHPSGILKPENLWKALGIILEQGLISPVEWRREILPFLMGKFGSKENARASGVYQAASGIDYIKFSDWINEPLPDFHTDGHGHMIQQKRHRHRLEYHARAHKSKLRRNKYGDALGQMTDAELEAAEREEIANREVTPPVEFEDDDDLVGQAYGKHSGLHDHWDSEELDEQFKSLALPMVDQQLGNLAPGSPEKPSPKMLPVPPSMPPPQGGNRNYAQYASPLQKRVNPNTSLV